MKRIFPIIVLVFLLCLVVFPVSAVITTADTRTISIHWGDARTFEFVIQDGWYWGDLCEDGIVNGLYDVQRRDNGTVYLVSGDGSQTFRIKDSAGTNMHISNAITEDHYYADLPEQYFDLRIQNASGLYDSYRMYGTYFNSSLECLVADDVSFHSDTLGVCKFVYLVENKVVGFRVGIQEDSSYTKDYILCRNVNGFRELEFAPASVLCNEYIAGDLCDVGFHPYDDLVTVVEPTCTETGLAKQTCLLCDEERSETLPVREYHSYGAWTVIDPTCTEDGLESHSCKFCGYVDKNVLPALGHDYPLVGKCRREGCDSYTGKNVVDGVSGFFGGLFGGDSSEGDSAEKDSLLDKIVNLFETDNTGNAFVDGTNGLVRLIGVVILALLVFLLWKPLKWLVDLILDVLKAAVRLLKKGYKAFRNWLKSLKKKK